MNRIYLVRHGENRANITKEFSCRKVDYPLTLKGRLQAVQTGLFFAGIEVDYLFSSPLKRARETASEISKNTGCAVSVVENFREINVGNLEDCPPTRESWKIYNSVVQSWIDGDFEVSFPGGENRTELSNRMRDGLSEVLRGKNGKSIVIVGHGGIFTNGVISLCFNADANEILSIENHNCSISVIDCSVSSDSGNFLYELKSWADVSHLSGEAADFVGAIPDFEKQK